MNAHTLTSLTGTVYRTANVREKVTYAYLELEDGRKVDVIAFPKTQPHICTLLADLPIGQDVTLSGRTVENDKSKYAIQFIAENVGNETPTDLDEYQADDMVWVSTKAGNKIYKRFGDLTPADQEFLRNWVCPVL